MIKFLDIVAENIAKSKDGISNETCIVLPNRRAKLFLRTELAKHIEKPVFLPEILSIEDFIYKITGLNSIDITDQIFELYNAYKQIEGPDAQSFEEFSAWGSMFLSDINEIDLYLADANQLFTYLLDAKNISHWSPDGRELTEFQKRYIQFFSKLGDYYHAFNSNLKTKNVAYQGLAYRYCAENLLNLLENFPWKKIWFCGFNALSASEEKIIGFLLKSDKAEVIWDTDEYYMKDNYQESGSFLRNFITKFPQNKDIGIFSNYKESKKQIHIIGVAGQLSQAREAGKLIEEWTQNDKNANDNIDYAVVLADENLLMPLLHSLPEDAKKFNITMGYPLKNTNPWTFVYNWMLMIETGIRMNQKRSKGGFYYKDVIRLLNNPLTSKIFAEESTLLKQRIVKSGKIFVSIDFIKKILCSKPNETVLLFDNQDPNPEAIINRILNLIELLKESISEDDILLTEFTFQLYKVFQRIQQLQAETHAIENIKSIRKLYENLSSQISIPFYGEPLTGIQIMGMLETRTLDFKNVIILGANEGTLPAGKSTNSFIPNDIKSIFSLPAYPEKDAIFAYHFYRLLQRAENITILYNTEAGTLGGNELSRYAKQLEQELPKYNSDAIIRHRVLASPINETSFNNTICVDKTDSIRTILAEKLKSGLSPTSLTTYNRCSLQFYFNYILKVAELDEVSETPDAADLGKIIHQVFEDIYNPFVDKIIKAEMLIAAKEKVREFTKEAFKIHFPEGDLEYGKNLLIYEAACKMISNLLDAEIKRVNQYEIVLKSIEHKMRLNFEHLGYPDVCLTGTADRIETENGITTIIDYKTGKVDPKTLECLTIEEMFDSEKEKEKALQTISYALLLHRESNISPIQTGILSTKTPESGLMKTQIEKTSEFNPEILGKYESYLMEIIQKILNPDLPFKQTEDLNKCKNCSFIDICGR